MYDLHTHTFQSDGELTLAELARRCQNQGYRGLAISDHCDHANIEQVVRGACTFCSAVRGHYRGMEIVPACEITHVPPDLIAGLVERARQLGARLVLVHGETIVEPVQAGTNRAALEAGVDVLAHPGLIDPADVALAARRGVLLEISGRKGHCLTNGHVARLALQHGAKLSFGSDGHEPGEFPDRQEAARILRGAGLTDQQVEDVFRNNAAFFEQP